MTTIGSITLQAPSVYQYGDYDVKILAKVSSWDIFKQLREMFARCRAGSAVQETPGDRPLGIDHTEDSVLTVYCAFTHGNKPRNGYYLLKSLNYTEDPSAMGLSMIIEMNLFFIGSTSFYQEAYSVYDLDEVENDWDL